MQKNISSEPKHITPWHRNLLVIGAVFTVLLIAMGGVLCVTQSIRNCPDWPGCFGKIVPPAETGAVLEVTHRLLAGISSLLIVSTAVIGMVRVPRMRWISIPPLVALALLLEVSYFGAQVVLRGLSPGWAAVDVGSALLVVALMVIAAVKASHLSISPAAVESSKIKAPLLSLGLVTAIFVYAVLVSGILVAGKGSITSCLGWPIYNVQQLQLDGLTPGNIVRISLSIVAIGLMLALMLKAWQMRLKWPRVFRIARWMGLAFLLEALVQVLLQFVGFSSPLLVIYTIVAAALWALLVVLVTTASKEAVLV